MILGSKCRKVRYMYYLTYNFLALLLCLEQFLGIGNAFSCAILYVCVCFHLRMKRNNHACTYRVLSNYLGCIYYVV